MKKVLKTIGAFCLFLLGAVFLLGTIADERHLLYAVLTALCILGGVLLLRNKTKVPDLEPVPQAPRADPEPAQPDSEPAQPDSEPAGLMSQEELQERVWVTAAAMVPKSDDEKTGDHDFEYVRVGLYRPARISGPMPRVGTDLFFEEEPENEYDDQAVVARLASGEPVGYLNKGKIRNAVRRALDDFDTIDAQVSRADTKLECYIAIDKA